jgi:hypothetical protein
MKPSLGILLALALLSAAAPARAAAPLAQTEGPHCLRTDTPPPPPDGGVVLARPLDPNSSESNVVVLPAYAVWIAGECGAAVMSQPASISVASPAFHNTTYAAIAFLDQQHGLTSAWGSQNVNSASPAPLLFPDRSDFTTTRAMVWSGYKMATPASTAS